MIMQCNVYQSLFMFSDALWCSVTSLLFCSEAEGQEVVSVQFSSHASNRHQCWE